MSPYYEQIEAYLDGTLSPKELHDFEEALKSDQGLNESVNEFKLAKKISKTFIELETRQHLNALKTKKVKFNWMLRIAAGLILGFVCIYYLYPKSTYSKSNPDQIFASLYEKPASTAYRSETVLKNNMDSAIYQFDLGNLDQSQHYFSNIRLSDTTNELALKYLAHIQLQKKNYNEAKIALEKLSISNKEAFKTEALYYLCMLDLMNNNISDAKLKFEQIKNNSLIARNKITAIEYYLK